MTQASKAMEIAKRYEKNRTDTKPKDVSRNGRGYDLEGSDGRKIEVKGCRSKQGIPDAHMNEFHRETLKLRADYLYVVRFDNGQAVGLYTIPKAEVDRDSEDHMRIEHVRLVYDLRKKLMNRGFPNRLEETKRAKNRQARRDIGQ